MASLEGIVGNVAEAAINKGPQNATPAPAASPQAAAALGATPHVNMLIVEQEAYTRTLIREVARTLGAEHITVASDAKAAFASLDQKAGINLIVCDLRLPDMTGLELLSKLRRRTPRVSFMLLSDHAEPAHIQMAVDSGVDAIVVKPFSRAQLETKLRYLARRIGAANPPRPSA